MFRPRASRALSPTPGELNPSALETIPEAGVFRLWPVAVVGILLGAAYVVFAPPGQPYDEPAHWGNVAFYATHGRMPITGEPGSTYESQMGPLYYTLAAVVVWLMGGPGEVSFWVTRVLGLALIPVLTLITFRLAVTLTNSARVARWAAALVALNPLLLAMGASVSNDYLVICLGAAVCLQVARWLSSSRTPTWQLVVIGGTVGAAVLTKVVAVSLALAFTATVLLCRGSAPRERVRRVAITGVAAVVVSGWWFLRNVLTYGDLTGAAGVVESGTHFAPLRLGSVEAVQTWASQLVTYVFAPVEYYRNDFDLAAPAKGLVLATAAITIVAVAEVSTRWYAGRSSGNDAADIAGWFQAAVILSVIVAYLYFAIMVWAIPPRLLALGAAPAAVLLATTGRLRRYRWLPTLTLVTYTVATLVILWSLHGVTSKAYWMFG